MKVTIKITDTLPTTTTYSKDVKTRIVADVTDVEFTPGLTASFLRALADEIAPLKVNPEPMIHRTWNPLSPTPPRPQDQWTITCINEATA